MSLFDLFTSELYLVWYSTVVSDNENRTMIERQLVADKILQLIAVLSSSEQVKVLRCFSKT